MRSSELFIVLPQFVYVFRCAARPKEVSLTAGPLAEAFLFGVGLGASLRWSTTRVYILVLAFGGRRLAYILLPPRGFFVLNIRGCMYSGCTFIFIGNG